MAALRVAILLLGFDFVLTQSTVAIHLNLNMSLEWAFLVAFGLVSFIMLLALSRPHHLRWDEKLGLWLACWRKWCQDLQVDIECTPLQQKLEELVKRRGDLAERILKSEQLRNPNQKRKW